MTNPYYITFYWGVLTNFGLSPTEAILMTLIEQLSKSKGVCFAAKKTLAATLNVSEPTIYNAIKSLVAKELLEKGGYYSNRTVELRPSDLWNSFILELKKGIEEMKNGKLYKN